MSKSKVGWRNRERGELCFMGWCVAASLTRRCPSREPMEAGKECAREAVSGRASGQREGSVRRPYPGTRKPGPQREEEMWWEIRQSQGEFQCSLLGPHRGFLVTLLLSFKTSKANPLSKFYSWVSTEKLNHQAKNWLIGRVPHVGKDWRQEEKGSTEAEMAGWHHWLSGHEFV